MYTQAYKNVSEQFEKILSPYILMNKLVAKNIQELTELNINALRMHCNEGIISLNALSEIKNFASLTAYHSQQLQSMAKMAQQCIQDGQHYVELAKHFKAEVETMVSETAKQAKPV